MKHTPLQIYGVNPDVEHHPDMREKMSEGNKSVDVGCCFTVGGGIRTNPAQFRIHTKEAVLYREGLPGSMYTFRLFKKLQTELSLTSSCS